MKDSYKKEYKHLAMAIAIVGLIIFVYIKSVEASNEITMLQEQIVAHELAMKYANQAIHTFADAQFLARN
jgi:cell division protein FtsL